MQKQLKNFVRMRNEGIYSNLFSKRCNFNNEFYKVSIGQILHTPQFTDIKNPT